MARKHRDKTAYSLRDNHRVIYLPNKHGWFLTHREGNRMIYVGPYKTAALAMIDHQRKSAGLTPRVGE